MKTLAQLVYEKTRYTLVAYCELRGISINGVRSGYISDKNAKIFESDGIEWQKAKNAKVKGGRCGVRKSLNAMSKDITNS